jgi:hypothetical protein
VGLLRGSFRPTDAIVALRASRRHRQTLIESAGAHIQRMQKALVPMTLQLPLVVSDLTGVTGLRILRDIIAGRRDPSQLADHRDHRCRASPSEKHFTSWLTLAPKNKISGGRLLSSRTQPSANRAAAILRMTVMSLGRTQTALGAFSRRVVVRIGKPQAIPATARKLAILIDRA